MCMLIYEFDEYLNCINKSLIHGHSMHGAMFQYFVSFVYIYNLPVYFPIAYPGFCRCVCTFCFFCVFWGVGVGVGELPPHPTKEKGQGSAQNAVGTSSYATAFFVFFINVGV